MSLFSFFKKGDKVGLENTIDSKDLSQDLNLTSTAPNRDVKTKLSYHPEWQVPQEQQYIFSFLANELEPLKPNQLSLSSISIETNHSGDWDVRAFFRSSLSQAIELGEIELFILDKEDNRVAAQTFNFKDLGVIPPESARPWVFNFNPTSIEAEEAPAEESNASESITDENIFFQELEKNFQKDRLLGHTSFGVHRDDYKFFFNQTDASGAASRGEVRSMILALKFIEAKQLVEKNGKKPVILLDDVFSELDEKRQKCLVKNFKDNQVIITSVNAA